MSRLYGIKVDVNKWDTIKLYVEKEIDSDRFDDPKLIFTVDPSTLQPNPNVIVN